MDAECYKVDMCVSLSSICNRGCTHCIANATMTSGNLFSIESALALRESMLRLAYEFIGHQLIFFICFTGNGEALLNPNLVEILDILFEMPNVYGSMVTSGINSLDEEIMFRKLISRLYSDRLTFSLSFSFFQKSFPRRLSKTLEILLEHGHGDISIKTCLPLVGDRINKHEDGTAKQIRMIKHIIKRILDKHHPLFQDDRIGSTYLSDDTGRLVEYFNGTSLGENDLFEETRKWRFNISSLFKSTMAFSLSGQERIISITPQLIIRQGRAKNLPSDLSIRNMGVQGCLIDNFTPHLSTDGDYYINCDCPHEKDLRIGNISDDISTVIKNGIRLSRMLLIGIMLNRRPCDDICDLCASVAYMIMKHTTWKLP